MLGRRCQPPTLAPTSAPTSAGKGSFLSPPPGGAVSCEDMELMPPNEAGTGSKELFLQVRSSHLLARQSHLPTPKPPRSREEGGSEGPYRSLISPDLTPGDMALTFTLNVGAHSMSGNAVGWCKGASF